VWKAVDTESGKIVALGESRVGTDGKSGLAYSFPVETGGALLEIIAEPVFAAGDPNADEGVEPGEIWVGTFTTGDLTIPPETSVHDVEKPFGLSFPLIARATGAVKDVKWYADFGSGAEAIGDGEKTESPKYASKGNSGMIANFWAEGKMPDGSVKRTVKMRVTFYCPPLAPKIKTSDRNGVERGEFGFEEKIDFKADTAGASVSFVWDFGDGSGATNTASTATHAYSGYEKYTVTLTSKCKDCGETETVSTVVETKKGIITADFRTKPDKDKFVVGSMMTLEDASSGQADIALWRWQIKSANTNAVFATESKSGPAFVRSGRTDNVEWLEMRESRPVVVKCTKRGEFAVALEVVPKEGGEASVTDFRPQKIRFSTWYLILLLIPAGIASYVFIGNTPKYWSYDTWPGNDPDVYRKNKRFRKLKDKWSRWSKRARIPIPLGSSGKLFLRKDKRNPGEFGLYRKQPCNLGQPIREKATIRSCDINEPSERRGQKYFVEVEYANGDSGNAKELLLKLPICLFLIALAGFILYSKYF